MTRLCSRWESGCSPPRGKLPPESDQFLSGVQAVGNTLSLGSIALWWTIIEYRACLCLVSYRTIIYLYHHSSEHLPVVKNSKWRRWSRQRKATEINLEFFFVCLGRSRKSHHRIAIRQMAEMWGLTWHKFKARLPIP